MDLVAMLVFGYLSLVVGLALGVVVGIRAEKEAQSDRMKQVADCMANDPEAIRRPDDDVDAIVRRIESRRRRDGGSGVPSHFS